jgi:hypothetical protein
MVGRRDAKQVVRLAVVIALGLATTATGHAVTRTTAPGVIAHVPIVLSATKIDIPKDQFVLKNQSNVARYPRGATIDFGIKNTTGKRAVLELRLTSKLNFFGASKLKKLVSTKPLAPGASTHIRASFFFRAHFDFELLVGGKVVAHHPMVIF